MIDLFSIVVDENKLHHNFKYMLNPDEIHVRNLLNSWTEGFVDRDNKMVKEFQTTFNSVFWELYLFNLFKHFQLTVNFTKQTPDFFINEYNGICVEAVIANNAENATPEWETDVTNPDLLKTPKSEIIRTATIRLANAITSKYKKYEETYSKLDWIKGKPFLLAVAPFEQPFFYEQASLAITRVSYGFDMPTYQDIGTKRIYQKFNYIHSIEKDNGSEIPLGFFLDDQMEEVSGIIFSNVATFGKIRALAKGEDPRKIFFNTLRYNAHGIHPFNEHVPKEKYTETIDDGIALYLNPHCKYELPTEFIDKFQTVVTFDLEERILYGKDTPNTLLARFVMVLTLEP